MQGNKIDKTVCINDSSIMYDIWSSKDEQEIDEGKKRPKNWPQMLATASALVEQCHRDR